jgi:hypothetical protein
MCPQFHFVAIAAAWVHVAAAGARPGQPAVGRENATVMSNSQVAQAVTRGVRRLVRAKDGISSRLSRLKFS